MLFFGFQETCHKFESNRPERFESEQTVRTDRCRPIGLFICKESKISAKEPSWAFSEGKNGEVSGKFLHLLRVAKIQLARGAGIAVRVFPHGKLHKVFGANGVRSAVPKIKKSRKRACPNPGVEWV